MNNIFDSAKITPQKNSRHTPQKNSRHNNKLIEEALFSPFHDSISINLFTAFTPLRKQPDYLLSPSPIKKDLFTQLLGTETRQYSPAPSIQEEESLSFSEISEEENDSLEGIEE